MTTLEKFGLKWNDFQQKILTQFSKLKEQPYFADDTLVSEDTHQIEAHRSILSSICTSVQS